MKQIELLKEMCNNLELLTEYDIECNNETVLIYKIANKVNELISMWYSNDNKYESKFTEISDKLNYLLGQGMVTEIKKIITDMYTTGKLQELVEGSMVDIRIKLSKNQKEIEAEKTERKESINSVKNNLENLRDNVDSVRINVKNQGVLGVGDETLKIQRILDNAPNGSTIVFPRGTYTVSQNKEISGDNSPCLILESKRNVTIEAQGVKFKVETFGQGILEIDNCFDCKIIGKPHFEGYGQFPSLEGTTGRGEKARTINTWNMKKNNEMKSTTAFGGGYEGNAGIGILITNGSERITLDVEASGFNYAGISVGFIGTDSLPYSRDITFSNCYVHDIYNAGINLTSCIGAYYDGSNLVERIGHPQARITDDVCDPGYGLTCSGIGKISQNVIISNMKVKNCKRKGLDIHAGTDCVIENSYVEECYICGIYGAYSSSTQPVKNNVIKGNTIKRCGIKASGSEGGIYVQGLIDSTNKNDIILNDVVVGNTLIECYGSNGIISSRRFDNLVLKDNVIRDCTGTNVIGIFLGRKSDKSSTNGICENNTIIDEKGITTGIDVGTVINGSVSNNNVILKYQGAVTTGIKERGDSQNVIFANNTAIVTKSGSVAFSLANPTSKGLTSNNTGLGGIYDTNRGNRNIRFSITFNGTNTPTITHSFNSELYIDRVASISEGIQIFLKESAIREYAMPFINFDGGASGLPNIDYMYIRGIDKSSIKIGLKQTKSSTHTAGSAISSGALTVNMNI